MKKEMALKTATKKWYYWQRLLHIKFLKIKNNKTNIIIQDTDTHTTHTQVNIRKYYIE